MKLVVTRTPAQAGEQAAKQAADILNAAIREKGKARLLLSTGASQLPFFKEFVKQKVAWERVEMFHLDEYVGICPDHPASFNRYIRREFLEVVFPGMEHLIMGCLPPEKIIEELTQAVKEAPIDLGMIGIGENAHIAFNDPPADFQDTRSYKVVTLAPECIRQQVREGWFKDEKEAYKQAITMTCKEILNCRHIISVVPYAVKAQAVLNTFTREVTEEVPATLLKTHGDCTVYCDKDSAALLPIETVAQYK